MLKLEICTPQMLYKADKVDYISLPGVLGEVGVLPGHRPLLTIIDSGILSFQKEGNTVKYAVHYGFAHIKEDCIQICVRLAENAANIDVERARRNQQMASSKMSELIAANQFDSEDVSKLQSKITRSQTRINSQI